MSWNSLCSKNWSACKQRRIQTTKETTIWFIFRYSNVGTEGWKLVWTIYFEFTMGTGNIETSHPAWPGILDWKYYCKIHFPSYWSLFISNQYQVQTSIVNFMIVFQRSILDFLWTLLSLFFTNIALDEHNLCKQTVFRSSYFNPLL